MLAATLQAEGFHVVTAFDAMSGFSLVMRERPQLLILDVSMPAGGGLSIAERMRKIPALSQVPIVVITASDDPVSRARANAIGAGAFLVKPVGSMELCSVVAAMLSEPQ